MNFNRHFSPLRRAALTGAVAITALLFTSDAFARVGGGGSYGGGGGHGGGGGGGGGGALGFLIGTAPLWVTDEPSVKRNSGGIIALGFGILLFSPSTKKK